MHAKLKPKSISQACTLLFLLAVTLLISTHAIIIDRIQDIEQLQDIIQNGQLPQIEQNSNQSQCQADQLFTQQYGCIKLCSSNVFRLCGRDSVSELEGQQTCAYDQDGNWIPYQSKCKACSQQQILGVSSKPCQNLPKLPKSLSIPIDQQNSQQIISQIGQQFQVGQPVEQDLEWLENLPGGPLGQCITDIQCDANMMCARGQCVPLIIKVEKQIEEVIEEDMDFACGAKLCKFYQKCVYGRCIGSSKMPRAAPSQDQGEESQQSQPQSQSNTQQNSQQNNDQQTENKQQQQQLEQTQQIPKITEQQIQLISLGQNTDQIIQQNQQNPQQSNFDIDQGQSSQDKQLAEQEQNGQEGQVTQERIQQGQSQSDNQQQAQLEILQTEGQDGNNSQQQEQQQVEEILQSSQQSGQSQEVTQNAEQLNNLDQGQASQQLVQQQPNGGESNQQN